eukprot:Platyproteum_vivax@DN4796_c0_g1_i1.p1
MPTVQKEDKKLSLFVKALTPGIDWDKEELKTTLHWLKQATGLLLGIIWGIVPFTGPTPLIVGVLIVFLSSIAYTNWLQIDETTMEKQEIIFEGAFPGILTFVLFWVLGYTIIHN